MSNTITKIEIQKKNENRVNIFIDGEFSFSCSSELVYYHKLHKGRVIEIEDFEKVISEDNYIRGKNVSLKYIERTLKTEAQIREYLVKKEFDENTIDRVINFLKEYKFIDDYYYTKAFINTNIKSWGKNKIIYNLKSKGIDDDIINRVINELPMESEITIALSLAEKKLKLLCNKENSKIKILQKLSSYLVSRGYNFEIINEVISKMHIEPKQDSEKCEEDKYSKLLDLASGRYEKLKKSEQNHIKLKKKLQDFLLRKGYNYDEIKECIKHIEEEDF